MRRLLLALTCAASVVFAQPQAPSSTADLAGLLSFEAPHAIGLPDAWGGSAATVFLDKQVVHGGRASARIERAAASPGQFSTLTRSVAIDFGGQRVQIRGFLRTEDRLGRFVDPRRRRNSLARIR